MSTVTRASVVAPTTVPWRDVLAFVVLAYALMWALTLPLWLSGRGLATPGAVVIMAVAMLSPAAASWLVCRVRQRRSWLLGVGLRTPGRRVGVTVVASVLAALVVPAALVVATGLGPLVGVRLDLTGLSGVAAYTDGLGLPATLPPPAVLLLVLTGQALIASVSLNAVLALGEETGWRGWLLPTLLPLGRLPALVITGVVWAVWHLPLILLGYEYPGAPRGLAVLTFVGFCVAAGALLGWFRLRTGSVVPAAVAHGAINAWAGLPVLLVAVGTPAHPLLAAPAGLLVSAALAVVAALLWWRRPPVPPG